MSERTSHLTIFLRYILLFIVALPIVGGGILLALPLMPVIIVLAAIAVASWFFNQAFTHWFTKTADPEFYNKLKEAGGDPYYDSLGAPLNFDSDEVRCQGVYPNAICPNCGNGVYINPKEDVSCCGNCHLYWTHNDWWVYDGSGYYRYSEYNGTESDVVVLEEQSSKNNEFWTGEQYGKT